MSTCVYGVRCNIDAPSETRMKRGADHTYMCVRSEGQGDIGISPLPT